MMDRIEEFGFPVRERSRYRTAPFERAPDFAQQVEPTLKFLSTLMLRFQLLLPKGPNLAQSPVSEMDLFVLPHKNFPIFP